MSCVEALAERALADLLAQVLQRLRPSRRTRVRSTCGSLRDLLLRRASPASWWRPRTGRLAARAGERTFWSSVELALITGMNTPSRSVVSTTVTIAARLGAALRRSARKASAMKKNKWPSSTTAYGRLAIGVALAPTPISARTRTANSLRRLVVGSRPPPGRGPAVPRRARSRGGASCRPSRGRG